MVLMSEKAARPFESIESALEFMVLLEEAIGQASGELEDMRQESSGPRQTEAIALALYKMGQLASYTQKSRRILNDLGLIRALLLGKASVLEPPGAPAGDE
jgi:hypothetical protein